MGGPLRPLAAGRCHPLPAHPGPRNGAGTTPRALRLYEARGLRPPPPRTPSGQRAYTPADVARVHVIRTLLSLGLPLEDLRRRAHLLPRHPEESCDRAPGELSGVIADRLPRRPPASRPCGRASPQRQARTDSDRTGRQNPNTGPRPTSAAP
ncbi:MAG TPA: MerR family transcriptional regulator [Streptomyces sp.]